MSRTGRTVRASFLGVQVALSVMLLIGAGVLYALTLGSVKGFAYFLAL